MSDALSPKRSSTKSGDKNLRRRSHDPLGDRLRAEALAFRDEIVTEAGAVLVKGMRGELPGSDAREQRLCAQAIRAERVPSASSQPTVAPVVQVRFASYAVVSPQPVRTGFGSQQLQAPQNVEWTRSDLGPVHDA
jgi:hypothetical protein